VRVRAAFARPGWRRNPARASPFGWTVGKLTFDWQKLCAARDAEVDRLENIYLNNALEGNGVKAIRQRATLAGEQAVELADGTRLTAKTILVATGGRPSRLPIEGAELAIVSDDIFHLPTQPKSMVVVGGGYIAAEFACIFAGLGTKVSMVNRSPTVLKAFDHDLQETLIEEMDKKGLDLHLGDAPVSIEDLGETKRVTLKSGATLEADVVFMATGRHPNTKDLGLEALGIETGAGGEIKVDQYSQTSVPSIYAVGDVTDRAQLTPVAIREGAQPEIGTIGLSENEAREKHDIEIYRAKFRPMLHTLSGRDEKMLMKIVVDKSNRKVLGVHLLGHGAGEMIQCVGIAVKMGATKEDFDRTMAVHPTAAEELVTMKTPVA